MDDRILEGTPLNIDLPTDEQNLHDGSLVTSDKRTRGVSLPKYQYNRDELLALKETRHSRLKPKKLPKEFELEDGHWDPDKWFYNNSHSNEIHSSKLENQSSARIVRSHGNEEKFSDLKHSVSGVDFKRSSAQSLENESEIILGPQRNSFNTGCNALHAGRPRDLSPHREGRERNHRIGSGRVQVNDRRSEKLDTDGSERRGGAGGVIGHFEYDRKDDRYRRGERREMNSRGWNKRDRSSEGNRRGDNRMASGSRSHTEAAGRHTTSAEPEWFTRGPSSRADIIELHGFRTLSDDVDSELEKRNKNSSGMNVTGSGDSVHKKNEAELDRKNCVIKTNDITLSNPGGNGRESNKLRSRSTVVEGKSLSESANVSAELRKRVGDRSAASDKCDTNDQSQTQEFYFNELFKDNSVLNFIEPESVNEGSSRFQAFFNLQKSDKIEDENQPSLFERFPYLNDILDGSLPPSPPVFGHELSTAAAGIDNEEQRRFRMMLEKANLLPTEDTAALKTQFSKEEKDKDVTENLKKLLKLSSSTDSNAVESLQNSKVAVMPSGNKALLAEDLEANFLINAAGEKRKIIGQNFSCHPAAPLLPGSKFTMVADLEDSLMVSNDKISSQKPPASGDCDGQDLTAFNRLLELVQGSGRQPLYAAVQNDSSASVAFTNNSRSISQSTKPTEQLTLNSVEESPACPPMTHSRMGHQAPIINRPITPSTSSPIMFGSQPPTNLMMPLALRSLHGQSPSLAIGRQMEFSMPQPIPQPQQGSIKFPDRSASGVEPLLMSPAMNIGRQAISSPSHPSLGQQDTSSVMEDALSNDSSGKLQKDSETIPVAFLPTAVMRKMVTNRMACRNTGDKVNVSNSHSTGALEYGNPAQYSNMLSTGGSIHMANAGIPRQSSVGGGNSGGFGVNGSVTNVRQGLSLQHNQILEAVKGCLAGATAVQPLSHRVMSSEGQSIGMNRPAMNLSSTLSGLPPRSLKGSTAAQNINDQVMLNDWAANELSRNAPHLLAHLQGQMAAGHGSDHASYQTMPNAFPSQLKPQSSNPMRPINVASWLQPHQATSGHLPTALTRPDGRFPVHKAASFAPVGRPIVKGNQEASLSAVQSMTQHVPQQQRQQQQLQQQKHLFGLNYPDSVHPANVFLPGVVDQWKQIQHGNQAANSLHSNGGVAFPTASSSISSSNYDSLNLSKLFGESLRHPTVPTMPSYQGHKAAMLTVDDIERRLASVANTPRLL